VNVRRLAAPFVALLGVSALTLGGCSVPDGSGARPIDSDIAALLTPSATPTPEVTARPKTIRLTWVRGDHLVQRKRHIPAETRQDRLDVALNELVAQGPRQSELAHGLETKLPPALPVQGVVKGHRVVLDVPRDSQTEPGALVLAVGQLATTSLSVPRVRTVVFTVDGERTAVPVPNGRPQRVLRMNDYRTVLKR
jgi:spore germination protein GerM